MLILGIDPGYGRLGWGLIDDEKFIAYGCLETDKNLPEAQRLAELFNQLTKLLKKYRPEAVSIESLFFFKNQTTVIKVAQARGVILLACEKIGISTFSYAPLQIKMAITGYGRADKNQIQQMTKSILKLDAIPQPDDAADALAIALTHSFSQKLKSKLQSTHDR
jgi:crossover junction endodeoxyribonuclease RuvC